MRVLYFIDEDHSDMFLTEDGKSGFVEDLIALLCVPHAEKYNIRKLFMEGLEEDPAIPDSVVTIAYCGYEGNPLDEYDFNTLWTFTEEF